MSNDETVPIYRCERCGAIIRTRHDPDVCGECDSGPITRIFGAAEPVYAVDQGAKDAGCRRQVVDCYRTHHTAEWDLFIALNVFVPDPNDGWDDPFVAIRDALDTAGYPCHISANCEHPGDEQWDGQIEIRVRYPAEDAPTFTEFMNNDSHNEANQ